MTAEFTKSLAGFAGGIVSYVGLILAEAASTPANAAVEWIGKLSLTGCLVYAVIYLNREVRRLQDLREADRKGMEEEYRKTNEANRQTMEKLGESVDKLGTIILRKMPAPKPDKE